jgi:hypothetical protein
MSPRPGIGERQKLLRRSIAMTVQRRPLCFYGVLVLKAAFVIVPRNKTYAMT